MLAFKHMHKETKCWTKIDHTHTYNIMCVYVYSAHTYVALYQYFLSSLTFVLLDQILGFEWKCGDLLEPC